MFDNLFISSPNGGGLAFIHNRKVYKIDNMSTTGLCIKGRHILRGIQPDILYVNNGEKEFVHSGGMFTDIHDVFVGDHSYFIAATMLNGYVEVGFDGAILREFAFPIERDAMHINSVCEWGGQLVYSAFGDFTTSREYKGKTDGRGYVGTFDGDVVIDGLSQPHTLYPIGNGGLLLCNSYAEEVVEYRAYPDINKRLRTTHHGGYTRGLLEDFGVLYVGTSGRRWSGVAGEVVALDSDDWEVLAHMQMPFREVYSIAKAGSDKETIRALAVLGGSSTFIGEMLRG